jgi:2-methylcitrate dehydratase PrpD
MNTTQAFARHALTLRREDVPQSAVASAKVFLLDTLGVGIAGARAPLRDRVSAAARGWGEGSVPVLGGGPRLPAPSAAFLNAWQIHGQEYDCVHEPAVVHPLAVIGGALMAELGARREAVTGAEFLSAMIAGVDVAAGLGVAAKSALRFFRPANAGGFGATLALARLRGFTQAQTLDALGLMLGQTAGTMQAHREGTPALPLQIGFAARGAITACDLVESGLTGPHDVFDGPFGYLELFEDETEIAPVLDGLGRVFRITEVSHKPFPTGRAAQGGILAVQRLLAQGVSPENLETLTLAAPPLIERLVGRPARPDMGVAYARLCFAYSGAIALQRGTVALDDFGDAALRDPATLALAARIRVESDGGSDPAAFAPQIAVARLKDGAERRVHIDALPGSPANPLTRDEHLAKFRACCAFAGLDATKAETLITLVGTFEAAPDARALLPLCTKG